MHVAKITTFFNEEESNETLTTSFLSYAAQEFDLPGFTLPKPYKLMKCVHSSEYRIIQSGKHPKTVFFVRLTPIERANRHLFVETKPGGKNLAQCMVWSSLVPNQSNEFQYVATCFFEYFLKQFDIVLTPGSETLCAAHFWEGRLLWSLTNPGVQVYHIDKLSDGMRTQEIATWLEFLPLWSEFIWESEKDIDPAKFILITQDRF